MAGGSSYVEGGMASAVNFLVGQIGWLGGSEHSGVIGNL